MKPKVFGQHRKRIDGVVALLMALSVLARIQPEPEITAENTVMWV